MDARKRAYAGNPGPKGWVPAFARTNGGLSRYRPVRDPLRPPTGKATMEQTRGERRVRSSVPVKNRRRLLCVFPHYTPAFGTFNHAYRLMKGVRAFMPPQGLLVIAAYMPQAWPVRFIDENIRKATDADFAWADAVLVSGMHVQAAQIHDIAARAHAAGKVVMLGGPSVSASPEMYPDIDYLHIGEIGDATDQLIARLDESVARPSAQLRLETKDRLPLQDFPIPAYDLIPLKNYLMLTLQFSSGCPYLCEFCDIPNLYGRQPRLKTPAQITAELDAMRRQKGHPPVVYFGDDNFIGNRKAAKDMLPHLLAWQKQHGYPLQFACEATLNIAKQPDILKLMRECSFLGIFVGIETPEADAQEPECRRADDGIDQDAQRLRIGGHLRHHPRARYRFRRYRGASERFHRHLTHPDVDHQPPAGAAEDAAVGSAQAGRTARGRSDARK